MNIDQMRYFKQICESHSLNKAAQELYISQPALTQSIQSMEKELNISLLVRDNTGVYPSEFGKIFLQDISSILTIYDDILQKINKVKQFSTPFTIYAYPAIANTYAPLLLNQLRNIFPSLELYFRELLPKDIHLLHDKPIALALVLDIPGITTFTSVHADYESITIKKDPIYAFVSRHAKWAKMKKIKKDCLNESSCVAFRDFDYYYSFFKRAPQQNINFTNNKSIGQEYILNQDAIQLLPLTIGKILYDTPEIVSIPTELDIPISYNMIVPHNLRDTTYWSVVEESIAILKNLLN